MGSLCLPCLGSTVRPCGPKRPPVFGFENRAAFHGVARVRLLLLAHYAA